MLARPDSALAAQLVPAPAGSGVGGDLVLVTVTDETPHGAVLQTLTAELGLSVEVVGGSVETVAGRRFGRLLLQRVRLSVLHYVGAGVCVFMAALTVWEMTR